MSRYAKLGIVLLIALLSAVGVYLGVTVILGPDADQPSAGPPAESTTTSVGSGESSLPTEDAPPPESTDAETTAPEQTPSAISEDRGGEKSAASLQSQPTDAADFRALMEEEMGRPLTEEEWAQAQQMRRYLEGLHSGDLEALKQASMEMLKESSPEAYEIMLKAENGTVTQSDLKRLVEMYRSKRQEMGDQVDKEMEPFLSIIDDFLDDVEKDGFLFEECE